MASRLNRNRPPERSAHADEPEAGLHHLAQGRVAGELPGVQVDPGQLGIVIQHLFEVRYTPGVIRGIAGEPSADHVIMPPAAWDAARAGPARAPVPPRPGGGAVGTRSTWVGGTWARAPAAVLPVVGFEQAARDCAQPGWLECRLRLRLGGLFEQLLGQLCAFLQDLLPAVLPGGCNRRQKFRESRQSVRRDGREVGAAVKRLQGGGQEDRHGPATLAGHGGHGRHVQAVQVGTFLPVDLDADEMVVEQRGGGGILEGFVRHDVAPVAGGIADAQEDGFLFPDGFGVSFRAPRIPVDRVIGVLAQVRGEGVGEVVGHGI